MNEATFARLLTGAALVFALVWSGYLARIHVEARASVLDRLEASLVDVRFVAVGRRPSPSGVVIVAVDDATARFAKTFPLPRRIMADLIGALVRDGAKAVALDFLFLDPTTPEGDDALARALRSGPTVIAAALDVGAAPDTAAPGPAPECGLPADAFRRASSIGFVNISVDRSGIARFVPMLLTCAGNILPALPVRATSIATGQDPSFGADDVTVGGVTTPLDVGRNLALRFYGPQGSIETISAAAVLKGVIPAERFRGKTVLIGATASGTGDSFATPFDSVLPGVEVLGTAIANLETGDALNRATPVRLIDAGLMMGLAAAAAVLLTMPNIGFGLAGIFVLFAAVVAFAFVSFAYGYWFSLALPLASLGPVAAVTGAARLGLDRLVQRRMVRRQATLDAFQSPAILAHLDADPEFLSRPVEREIAVVFIDLTGFTGLTERLGAPLTRDLIKQFHDLVEVAVSDGGGIVATYMADGAMLVWGFIESTPEDALRAVRTSITLQVATRAWLRDVRSRTGVELGVKLGGHFGPAILSRLGHRTHQHITAIGDTVNSASRLMEVAAANGAVMAFSAPLVDAAEAQATIGGPGTFTRARDVAIRGRERPIAARFWRETPLADGLSPARG